MSSRGKMLAMGGVLVAATIALAVVMTRRKRPAKHAAAENGLEVTEVPRLSEEQVVAFFHTVTRTTLMHREQLEKQVITPQLKAQMDPAQLASQVTSVLEDALQKSQDAELEKVTATEDEMESATCYYLKNESAKVQAGVDALKRVFAKYAAKKTFSSAKLLEILSTFYDTMTVALEDVMKELREEGADFESDQVKLKMHMTIQDRQQRSSEAYLKSQGMDSGDLQYAINKAVEKDPSFGPRVDVVMKKHQEHIAGLGLPMV